MTRARHTPAASFCLPRGLFLIAARGSISNSTPRISFTSVSTAAASCQRRRCFMRLGMTGEDILSYFYKTRSPTHRRKMAGARLSSRSVCAATSRRTDLINADRRRKWWSRPARKVTPRPCAQAGGRGPQGAARAGRGSCRPLSRRGLVNVKTGEIYAEAGEELDEKVKELVDAGFTELKTLDVDHMVTGAYMRNTLAVDKNSNLRTGADRHLPCHASGRAADAGNRRSIVQRPVLRL
jgi:hypothetical protein